MNEHHEFRPAQRPDKRSDRPEGRFEARTDGKPERPRRSLRETVMKDGRRLRPAPQLKDIRAFVKRQLDTEVWPEEQRFENPHHHYLDMSPAYYKMKMALLKEAQQQA